MKSIRIFWMVLVAVTGLLVSCSDDDVPGQEQLKLKIDQTLSLIVGETKGISLIVEPQGKYDVTWSSSDKSVATVDKDGKVTAVAVGETTITAKVSSYTASCKVSVAAKPVESVELSERVLSLYEGDCFQLTARTLPEDASVTSVVWSSLDEEVAQVSETGEVTALRAGQTSIKAAAGGKEAVCEVTVATITWDGSSSVEVIPSAEHTYDISLAAEWIWLNKQISNSLIETKNLVINLKKDLDFGNHEMAPLGSSDGKFVRFLGKLNGNGHTMKGVKITEGEFEQTGLIGQLNPYSEVRDLTVEGEVKGNVENNDGFLKGVGLVSGVCLGGKIINCVAKGKIFTAQAGVYIGGVSGGLSGGAVINCVNYADVVIEQAVNTVVGGVIGCMPKRSKEPSIGYVIACQNYGNIVSPGEGRMGGIVGEATLSSNDELKCFVVGCFNQGALSTTGTCDLFGSHYSFGCDEVYGCYNAGTLTAPQSTDVFPMIGGNYPKGGQAVFALADASDENPQGVGMQEGSVDCGKCTAADLNSLTTIDKLNVAIEAYHTAYPNAPRCEYHYIQGETYPVLVKK